MKDCVIIGAGPAGISAALYARRGGLETTVVQHGESSLSRAEKIENYYGFPEPIEGAELARRGIEGARRLGVVFQEGEVMELGYNDTLTGFRVAGKDFAMEAASVILALGASRQSLALPGLKALEGKGVSYCAVCDAFFYRGKTVGVIGAGEYARHEAEVLAPHVKKLLLLANGQPLSAKFPETYEIHPEKLSAILGEERVSGVRFADGSTAALDGVFLALGTAGAVELARKAGIMLDASGKHIQIGQDGSTNVPGIFAAGDCTGGLLQVAKAVHEGAEAGLSAVRYLKKKASGAGKA